MSTKKFEQKLFSSSIGASSYSNQSNIVGALNSASKFDETYTNLEQKSKNDFQSSRAKFNVRRNTSINTVPIFKPWIKSYLLTENIAYH